MKFIDLQIADEHWSSLKVKADKLDISVEEFLSRAVKNFSFIPRKSESPQQQQRRRVFVDTNVLALIVGDTSLGKSVVQNLKDARIEVVTLSKCIYELYSIAKGITKKPSRQHPLKDFLLKDMNSVGQKLFKKTRIDHRGITHYWFNLCEEWMCSDYFESYDELIKAYCVSSSHEEAKAMLTLQEKFVDWKVALRKAFHEIESKISDNGIQVF